MFYIRNIDLIIQTIIVIIFNINMKLFLKI